MADLEQVASDLNSASQSLQELREKYDGALDLLDSKNTEITGALYSAKSNALQEVQTASNTATSQISQLKDTSLNAVNEAKNTATSEISSKKEEALGEFSQATSEFNSTKEEALSQIEQAKAEQGEKITALEQAKESITADLNKKSKLLTENLTWTVGSGGDYEDLQTAINEASKYNQKPNIRITLKLISDLTITNRIELSYIDFRNIVIDGQDSYKIQKNCSAKYDYVFYSEMGFYPELKNLTIKNLSSNVNGIALAVFHESCLSLYNTNVTIDGFWQGLRTASSNLFMPGLNITNCTTGISSFRESKICMDTGSITNCTTGISVGTGTIFAISNLLNFSGNTSDCNISYNTLTANGIIFK